MAAAVKVAVLGATTVALAGWVVKAGATGAALTVSVPLLAEVGVGPNWDKAH